MQIQVNRVFKVLMSIAFIFLSITQTHAQNISLAGKWRFKIDAKDEGIKGKWYSAILPESVHLPGSMAGNLKGDDITLKTKWTGSIYDSSYFFHPRLEKYRKPGNLKMPFWLTPAKHYTGAAWYQKDIVIPASWKGKRMVLSLEYPHSETRVWIDDIEIGTQYTFVVAQNFELPANLKAGKHTITLLIDNRIKAINVGQDSHSLTDHTQGNWNGVVGKMEVIAGSPVYFEDIQVYPDLKKKSAKVKIQLKAGANQSSAGKIILSASSFNTKNVLQVKPVTATYQITNGEGSLEINLPMGDKIATWDEFDPALYRLTATLLSKDGKKDEKKVQFGMREFKAVGRTFEINGRPVFLRGTVNNCEFPLTGYPSMDVAAWVRIFKISKAHGLNHMRFHSFCPPEAAFIAADQIGFYLQPEGPSWANHGTSIGDGKPIDQFIYDETNRMTKNYGNYASFCMMAYGNEPRGRQVEYLTKFNNYWKAKDSRRLYTGASVGGSWPVIPNNEYMVRAGARGLDWGRKPESISTYAKQIEQFTVPFVAHEMGQYCAFPNFDEIKKYTGVYRAKNFEMFQEDLKDHDMANQGHDFLMASGKLQALCYKNEIEKALRTPNYNGYQLLSLNDYPGQGTALVGVLDAFWDEKGYITAKEFKRFSNSTVPLLKVSKFVFTNNETLEAAVEVAHFGQAPIENAKLSWTLNDEGGVNVAKGNFNPKALAVTNCIAIGEIKFPLSGITKAAKLKLEVTIDGTEFANDWNFWVYPAHLPAVKSNVYYCTSLDDKARSVLADGGNVFLNAAGKIVKGKEVVQSFLPVFWNTSWFKMRPPHTLGILCDPKHAAFKNFPTDYHSEMQWWEIVNKSQVMNLEDFPSGFRPIIQPIDTWFLNRRLALVFEAKVGKGKLVVSSANLSPDLKDTPASQQLYFSLQQYMMSDQFNPKYEVAFNTVKDIFESPSKIQFDTFTKDSPDELKPKPNSN
ncbi:exo-beta-1,4-galactosidase [Pedobacter alluvionis]|uniref:beta-galactosidase n=1 Tax=Pedobacter alluvionis TaxID=475253 RepID=A0A497XTY6_9SPHI|nr:sugar-binding domain-containing protein [Pedobacter alluvionis]RLJ72809.1 glycosyl hydrolase family 2 [Pedobacter alluvionis]TFB29351.1 beta-glucuronidase [Pedobacter alluvionis]